MNALLANVVIMPEIVTRSSSKISVSLKKELTEFYILIKQLPG